MDAEHGSPGALWRTLTRTLAGAVTLAEELGDALQADALTAQHSRSVARPPRHRRVQRVSRRSRAEVSDDRRPRLPQVERSDQHGRGARHAGDQATGVTIWHAPTSF
jgi:hypothetical protein